MGKIIVLNSSRGTNLYRNGEDPLRIELGAREFLTKIDILLVQGNDVSAQKVDIRDNSIHILPKQEYQIVNLSSVPITLKFEIDPLSQEILFDPYKYEEKPFDTIDPAEFIKDHPVPKGYIDILAKWYSIKFTYPNKNLIHIRPYLGISIQLHTERAEDWKIIQGHPIIIANSKIYYSVNPDDTFHTDRENLHGILNPTNNWVIIEEKYTGKFEEDDIKRVFNPNHYQ
jgi:hypothetical protein